MAATEHIRVSAETKEALNSIGSKGDTYDEIIRSLAEAEASAEEWRKPPEK